MSKWQSIETAPKDGTDILLAEISHDRGQISYGEIDIGAWQKEPMSMDEEGNSYWYWFTNFGRVQEPTHWMPLPEPPNANPQNQTDP